LYVGQTKDSLLRRESGHRTKSNNCCSKYIPDNIQWTIELIEECEDNISIQRERYYIELLEPLFNYKIPGRTNKEAVKAWEQKNKEKRNIYKKKLRKAKKAQIAQEHPAYSLLHQSILLSI
jgi:hypothetical protein